MRTSSSYVYFALKGDDFDPAEITRALGIEPTNAWRIGDKGKYVSEMKFSCWEWSTEKGKEPVLIDSLVDEVLSKLEGKEELIVALKRRLGLESVLEIVLDIDMKRKPRRR